MCILSDKEHMSVIHNISLCTSYFFVRMVIFETHGSFIYRKGNTKHLNEWKYKPHRHKKRLHPPIGIFKKVGV